MYNMDTNKEFIQAIEEGKECEIDEEIFDYYLDVLPPAAMGSTVTLVDGRKVNVPFCFAEGAMNMIAFWSKDGKYYAQQTVNFNPYAYG